MILHIPHASREIPAGLRDQIVLSDEELASELREMTDAFTDTLFTCRGATRIVFPVSRLIVDPERFLDDDEEPMSQEGMGVIYARTSSGHRLKRELSGEERERLINDYYKPHHERLRIAVEDDLASQGNALIVDCHSFPRQPTPCDRDQSVPRPDFCVGTDSFHTPRGLKRRTMEAILRGGFSVEENRPYAGTMVPAAYYRTDPRVWSIMIEVCRDLYMDEKSDCTNENFFRIHLSIEELLRNLVHYSDNETLLRF
ncbi:MAG: N-formylglutamate amidohydrolase [Deltaproteobacteria bacterium]|nr:N-formylglutamate amidohydrolase [Deltaproteobacteria bacterium]